MIKAQDLIDLTKIPVAGIFPIHPLGFAIPPSHLKKFIEKNKEESTESEAVAEEATAE